MSKGKVTFSETIDKKVFDIGRLLAEGNQPGIDSFVEMKSAIEALKQSAIDYSKIEKKFKVSENRKQFLEIKQQEEVARIKASNAIKLEKEALVSLEVVEQNKLRTEKIALSNAAKLQKSKQRTIKLTEKQRLKLKILNRGKREAAVLSSKLSTEYEKQAVRLIRLRRKYKDVALVQGESSKRAVNLRNHILKLDSALKKVDANVGQFQRSVGNYGKAMNSARNAARGLASAMGLVGGAFLVVQVVRDAVRIVRDFEKANATLSAILQVERSEMQGLTEDSIRLGAETVKTANEVTGLQIAYARLGFEQKEILNLTEATISGSIAMNAELDSTANLVGAVVNTFDDLSATDAPKIIDILSLSTAKSALSFQKLETGIPIVAGAANAAGVPFTMLVSLMGKLADSGIDVSSSSTAIRNIFIESAAQGLNYEEILEKIKGSQDKLTASNDEFGKRAAVSASVLANNIDKTKELDEALNNAAGTAERMANKELDTLDGSIKLLRSAWEGYILNLDQSSDSSTSLKNIISGLASNLGKVISIVINTAKAYAVYKGAVLLARLQTALMNKQLLLSRTAALASAKGISRASLSFAKFNKVLKANVLGLIVLGVTGLIYIFNRLNRSILDTVDELHKSNEEFIRQAGETQSVNTELSKMVDRYEELKNKTKLNSKEQKELNDIVKKIAKNVPGAVTEINKYGDALEINTGKTREFIAKQNEVNKLQAEDNIKNQKSALEELTSEQKAFNRVAEESNETYVKGFGVIKKVEGAFIKVTTQFSKTGRARFVETELTKKQVLEYKKYQLELEKKISTAQKDVEANEDIIASITGVKNARQLATEATENAIKEAEILKAKKEAEIRSVKNLKDKIKSLQTEQDKLTISDKKRSNEINKLIKLYQKEINKILGITKANKSAGNAEKEREAKRKKLIQDSFNLESFVFNQKIKLQQEISKNEKETFETREEAIIEAGKLEFKLALETATTKLLLKKDFSRQEIESLLEDGIASKELLNKISEEELLIIKQFEEKKRAIKSGTDNSLDDLSVDKIKEKAEKEKAIKEKALNDELLLENNAFVEKSGIYANAENAIELHEKRIAEIKKKHALEALDVQVKAIKTLIAATEEGSVLRAQYESTLARLQLDISEITTADFIEKSDKEVLTASEKAIKILDISSQLASALEGLGNAIFDSRIQNIEQEIEESDAKYDKEIERAVDRYDQNGILIEKGEERRTVLEKKKEEEREKLEKKKRAEQRKQAIFNKATAALNIAMNTAQAIMSIASTGGGTYYADFGVSAAALTAIYAGIGAAQLGAVLAAPLPKYKLGRGKGKNEFAEVGDGFVHEVVEKADGSAYLTPNRPTVTYLEKDDTVHSSLDKYLNSKNSATYYDKLFKSSILKRVDSDAKKANEHQKLTVIHNKFDETVLENAILKSGKNIEDRVVKAINKSLLSSKTVTNVNVEIPETYNKF